MSSVRFILSWLALRLIEVLDERMRIGSRVKDETVANLALGVVGLLAAAATFLLYFLVMGLVLGFSLSLVVLGIGAVIILVIIAKIISTISQRKLIYHWKKTDDMDDWLD